MDGIFIIDKPLGVTSFHIVSQIKKLMNTKKVGHCGTLDPMASGVLVICVNKATKISQFIMSDDKYYEATIKLDNQLILMIKKVVLLKKWQFHL